MNRTVLTVIYKDDRKFPYLKIKWDNVSADSENCKKFYDPFDVVKEIKMKYKEEKKKKVYENFYFKDKGVTDEKINQ